MADPTTDQVTVGIVLFVVTIVVVAFFELKFLRKRMKAATCCVMRAA